MRCGPRAAPATPSGHRRASTSETARNRRSLPRNSTQSGARAFASTFFFSEFPQIEQAPAEHASYGGIGEQAFAIESIEFWPRGRDFVVRAATGGACRCLGLEWIVSGPLEARAYLLQDNNARGFFRVPRTGSPDLLVRQVQTNILQAPANAVLRIDQLGRDENGTLRTASGRFVYTQQESDSGPRVWSAGRFDNAKVEPFEP